MPKRKAPIFTLPDSHPVRQIYREFTLYARDTGFYPTQNGLYSLMTEKKWSVEARNWIAPRYTMPRGTFDYWFGRLVEEDYIAVDGKTRSISATALNITDREGSNNQTLD